MEILYTQRKQSQALPLPGRGEGVGKFMTTGPKLVLSAYVAQPDACFLEWLAYHRAIGATDVVVFTDRRQSGKQPLFDALATAGALRIIPVAVDPDMKEEIHNSALRAARLEAEESGGYGLY